MGTQAHSNSDRHYFRYVIPTHKRRVTFMHQEVTLFFFFQVIAFINARVSRRLKRKLFIIIIIIIFFFSIYLFIYIYIYIYIFFNAHTYIYNLHYVG